MMIALCAFRIPEAASASKSCGRASPPKPNAPIFRKFRRETPSQNFELEPWIVSMISNQFANWLMIVIDQILRASGQVVQRHLVRIDAQVVVEGREDFAELHRALHRFATQAIGRANHLANLHSAAKHHRARDARPMIASAIIVDGRCAAEITPNDYGHVL